MTELTPTERLHLALMLTLTFTTGWLAAAASSDKAPWPIGRAVW